MSFINIFRLFAIYLTTFLILSESTSGFTVVRTKTTTLKSSYDLTGEESALLEVKYDLPKVHKNKETNQLKHYDKPGTAVPPTHTNILNAEGKATSSGKIGIPSSPTKTTTPVILTQTGPKYNVGNQTTKNNELTSQTTVRSSEIDKNKKVSTEHLMLSTENLSTILAESVTTLSPNLEESITAPRSNDSSTLYFNQTLSGLEFKNEDNFRERREHNVTTDLDSIKTEISTETTVAILPSSENIKEQLFTESQATEAYTELTTTQDLVEKITSFISPVSEHDSPANVTELRDDINSHDDESTIKSTPVAMISTTSNFSTVNIDNLLEQVEKENAVTNTNSLTETLLAEASSAATKVPNWKTYTTIDRKRYMTTTESSTTDKSEELARAETVTSKVTLDNAINANPILSLKEPQSELLSNSFVEATEDDTSTTKLSITDIMSLNTRQNQSKQESSTVPLNVGSTLTDYVSKRAGFLDLSAIKYSTTESSTTENELEVALNETELIGSMFEFDASDGEVLENKNTSLSESQSQLAEDAIKEELLKEQLLNDHVPKRYGDRVKPTEDSNSDDLLSVKPIGSKGNIYTVSPNYKPMKKIEVQPLKPFIRDPDDNSWRNESISSLGIVFKAKNASKPFTQVLKNKTEAELNSVLEKDEKNEVPDLRVRLEKIAEVRKSRKKKINKFGDIVYTDYEDGNSGEAAKLFTGPLPMYDLHADLLLSGKGSTTTKRPTTQEVYMHTETTTTRKPRIEHKHAEYYDTTDEYDDYTLPKIDLKKFTTQMYTKPTVTTPTPRPTLTQYTRPVNNYLPDRKPTVQYFPPRTTTQPQKVNVNDYDSEFEKKVNMFTYTEIPKGIVPPSFATVPTTNRATLPVTTDYSRQHKPANLEKNLYVTFPSQPVDYNNKHPANNDESFNRASYVIKHFKDLIDVAVKEDYERGIEYMPPFTEAPLTGVTITKDKAKQQMDDDYDYESTFRKDILNKFVDNFNQNSERFKVDFPILYNNSIVHTKGQINGKAAASSSAFLKGLYGDFPRQDLTSHGHIPRPCDHNCDVKVELSPAYELHYYVPDQEEKEVADPKPAPLPYNYRL